MRYAALEKSEPTRASTKGHFFTIQFLDRSEDVYLGMQLYRRQSSKEALCPF